MKYQIAQINIGRFRLPAEDPANADFMNSLEGVNAVAEGSPGFVWRLRDEIGGGATSIQAFDDPLIIVNMSVWESIEQLVAFAYRNMDHRGVMRRRREWFEEMPVYLALWWVPEGHAPTPAEGRAKIELLARLGPTQDAFTFKQPFPPPSGETIAPVLDECA